MLHALQDGQLLDVADRWKYQSQRALREVRFLTSIKLRSFDMPLDRRDDVGLNVALLEPFQRERGDGVIRIRCRSMELVDIQGNEVFLGLHNRVFARKTGGTLRERSEAAFEPVRWGVNSTPCETTSQLEAAATEMLHQVDHWEALGALVLPAGSVPELGADAQLFRGPVFTVLRGSWLREAKLVELCDGSYWRTGADPLRRLEPVARSDARLLDHSDDAGWLRRHFAIDLVYSLLDFVGPVLIYSPNKWSEKPLVETTETGRVPKVSDSLAIRVLKDCAACDPWQYRKLFADKLGFPGSPHKTNVDFVERVCYEIEQALQRVA
jgi:hypothetical protein